jgi:hypothetical protein
MRINRILTSITRVAHGPSASFILITAGYWLFFLLSAHSDPLTSWLDGAGATIEIKDGSGHLYRMPQNMGERDLHNLACSGEREDAWLYFADTWIDVGHEEKKKTITLHPGRIDSLLDLILKTGIKEIPQRTRIVIYHIHPLQEDRTGFHPPSTEDIYTFALLKNQCRRLSGAELLGKVFDGLGVWEYDISRDLEHRLCPINDAADPTKAEDLYPDYPPVIARLKHRDIEESFFFNHLIVTRSICQNPVLSRDEKIGLYIDSMRALGISVKYKSIR